MRFSLEVKMWTARAAAGLREARKEALLDIGTAIIAETPVKTGACMSNWQSSIGEAKEGKLPIRPLSAPIAELKETLEKLDGDQTFVMRNNLPYATRLEFGWSAQAPEGMVRRNVERWQGALDRAATKERVA